MNKEKKHTPSPAEGLTPELRFPEFEKEGEWKKNVLGSVCDFLKGKGISKSDITTEGIQPCVRYGELYTHYSEIIDSIISKTSLSHDQLVLSKKNDVIIPSSGETQEDIATASCLLEDNIALGGDINIIRTEIYGVFLAYYLSNAKKRDIAKLAQGNAVVHIYISQLEKLEIEIPSPQEQQKIASCLSSLDELIAAHNDKLDALKDHKKGLLQNLFPVKTQCIASPLVPKVRFPEFDGDGEWELKPLQNVSKITTGNKDTQDKIDNGEYPFFVRSQTIERINSYSFDGEAILTSGDGVGVGKIYHYIIGKFDFHQRVYCIYDFNKDVEGEFIFYFFSEHFYQRVMQLSAKNSVDSVRRAMITEMPIALPPTKKEQQKIASCLSAVDDLITAQQEKIEELQQHKKGLMQGLFPKMSEL